MTGAADRGPVCPHLGLEDDPATYFAFPSSAQRCHAKAGRPTSIEHTKQAQACLVVEHVRCGRYTQPQVAATGLAIPLGAVAGARLEPVPPAAARPRRGAASREPRRRSVGLALFGLLLIVVAGIGIVLGSQIAGGLGGGTPGSATGGAPASASLPVAPATPGPSPSPVPTSSPSPSPTSNPTPAPTPSPTPKVTPSARPTVHVVKSGETLTGIAARYGVTIVALQEANGIKDPNLIIAGQKLVIPAR